MFKNLDNVSKIGLLVCFGLLGFYLYTSSQRPVPVASPTASEQAATPVQEAFPANQKPEVAQIQKVKPVVESQTFVVENDQVKYTYSTTGGSLLKVEFKDQHQVLDPSKNVELNTDALYGIGAILNGPADPITLQHQGSQNSKGQVSFEGKINDSVTVQKVFTLIEEDEAKKTGYRTEATYVFTNTSGEPLRVSNLYLHMGTATPLHADEWPDAAGFFWNDNGKFKFQNRNSFNGSWFSSAKSRVTKDSEALEYFGVANQFFASVAKVNWNEPVELRASSRKSTLPVSLEKEETKEINLVDVSAEIPAFTLPANGSHTLKFELYTGPKEATLLKEVDPNLKKLMNYGFFGMLSPLLNWILNVIEEIWELVVASDYAWGLAIITLTLFVRTLMWPLHKTSITSMKRMSKLTPMMQKLREKYENDPQKMQIETMGLYKKYGVNPLSGCLPMLIQMPIFLGFFSMLRSASELRGQKFLWVEDLSLPDTLLQIPIFGGIDLNPLPILMAITSFIQMSMMPQQQGPQNPNMPDMRPIMKFMPVMFLFFCYNYAAALALYWTTTNLFSIFQTWYMQRIPEPELKEVALNQTKKSPGFFDKMKEQLEEAKRLQEEQNRKQRGLKDAKPKKRTPKTGG